MPAVLFGSISTIADTSELQREAFNRAFEAHGLDWRWDREEYFALLEKSGGEERIAAFAERTGESVDAKAIHRTKSELFQKQVGETPPAPREGVVETIREAADKGCKVALVTTTSHENVTSLIDALGPALDGSAFDLVVDAAKVESGKPDKAAYEYALEELGETPRDCVAIEDNLDGVTAAQAAGISCIAFPNANTAGHDFASADRKVERVAFSELQTIMGSGEAA